MCLRQKKIPIGCRSQMLPLLFSLSLFSPNHPVSGKTQGGSDQLESTSDEKGGRTGRGNWPAEVQQRAEAHAKSIHYSRVLLLLSGGLNRQIATREGEERRRAGSRTGPRNVSKTCMSPTITVFMMGASDKNFWGKPLLPSNCSTYFGPKLQPFLVKRELVDI